MVGLRDGVERRPQEGKLIAAVRRWAGGDAPARQRDVSPRPTASDWEELTGKPAPVGAEKEEPAEPVPDVVRVWSGVWPVFELFIAAERVWRYPALGGPPIGLDWAQVRPLADGYGVSWDRETLTLMQAAEAEAAGIWLAEWKRKNPPKRGR